MMLEELPFDDLATVGLVCKRWRRLVFHINGQLLISEQYSSEFHSKSPYLFDLALVKNKKSVLEQLFKEVGKQTRKLCIQSNLDTHWLPKSPKSPIVKLGQQSSPTASLWPTSLVNSFPNLVCLKLEFSSYSNVQKLRILLEKLGAQLEELSLKHFITAVSDWDAVNVLSQYLNPKRLRKITFETKESSVLKIFSIDYPLLTHFHILFIRIGSKPGSTPALFFGGRNIDLLNPNGINVDILNGVNIDALNPNGPYVNFRTGLQHLESLSLFEMYSDTPKLLINSPFRETLQSLQVLYRAYCDEWQLNPLTRLPALRTLKMRIIDAFQYGSICRNLVRLHHLEVRFDIEEPQTLPPQKDLVLLHNLRKFAVSSIMQPLTNLIQLHEFSPMLSVVEFEALYRDLDESIEKIDLMLKSLPAVFPKLNKLTLLMVDFTDSLLLPTLEALKHLKELNLKITAERKNTVEPVISPHCKKHGIDLQFAFFSVFQEVN